jgi:hypothetical protein
LHEGTLVDEWNARVAAHAGTAHFHAEPDQHGRRFLCVLLTAAKARPQFSQTASDRRQTGMTAHGDGGLLDRFAGQMQSYPVDVDQILVSHLITYCVRAVGRKRVGSGFDDPFLRKLSSAAQRSGSGSHQRSNSSRSRPQRGR